MKKPIAALFALAAISGPVLFHAPARAAAQSDCQTEDCQRARARQEGQCHHGSPPVSQLPARLQADRPVPA